MVFFFGCFDPNAKIWGARRKGGQIPFFGPPAPRPRRRRPLLEPLVARFCHYPF
jgi:hypothetical protein